MKTVLAVLLALVPGLPGGMQPGFGGQAAQCDSTAQPRSGSKDERRAASGQKGSITGRVVSESGQGLMLAQVRANAPGGALNSNAFTATDEDGSFELGGLTPRAYTVTAFAPGYVTPRNTDGPTFYRPGDSVTIRMSKGGVITGTVTGDTGDPIVGVPVNAIRVRNTEGEQAPGTAVGQQNRTTDDRGTFRVYGLEAGVYLVRAGGQRSFPVTPLDRDVPTYYPSSTRDTAVEVSVRSGEETSGIDIRYRGQPGRAISGTVFGIVGNNRSASSAVNVMLYRAKADWPEATTFVSTMAPNRSFAFYGVADGDYEVMAQRSGAGSDALASPTRRISVRGADVTGIDLALAPLGRISGRVVLETLQADAQSDCNGRKALALQETVLAARRYEKKETPPSHLSARIFAAPDEKSNFSLNGVGAGAYHLEARLPGDGWYLKSVSSPPAQGSRKSATASTGQAVVPVSVKAGERIDGLIVTFAEGAATLGGRVTAKEGARLPDDARAYLVPVEEEYANAPWRYGESTIRPDGSFAFTGVAPGRYWIVAGKYQEEISPEGDTYRTAWSAASRKTLRQEAEATGQTVEIKPCQRIADYSLQYGSR
jgi:hypothetical protein